MVNNKKTKIKTVSHKKALIGNKGKPIRKNGLFSDTKKVAKIKKTISKVAREKQKPGINQKDKPISAKTSPKTPKRMVFSKERSNEFYVKQTFEEYVSLTYQDKKELGPVYRLHVRFQKTSFFAKRTLKFAFKKGIKLAYRTLAIFLIAFFIYGAFPSALSSSKFLTITKKAEWEQGTFTNLTSETHGTNIDSIQLAPTGSWTARVWTASPDTISFGHSAEMAGSYLYVMRGYADNAFWRYDTVNNTWEEMEDLPQPADYGSDMAYLQSKGKIYAIFGGYSQKFYSYDISDDEWTEEADLLETVYTGASIETDGSDIYAVRGNNTRTFWKYNASAQKPSWNGIDITPATVYTGGNLVYGHDGYLYLTRGNSSLNFYRYDIANTAWDSTISSLPATYTLGSSTTTGEQEGTYWTNGTAKFLYFFRSTNTASFLRYQITCNNGTMGVCADEKDTWTALNLTEAVPAASANSSITYNANDGLLYALRSNASYDLWKYNPTQDDGQRWLGPRQAQTNAGALRALTTGGDLIWDGDDYVYTIVGGNNSPVQRYQISNNDWADCATMAINMNNYVKGTYNDGNIYSLQPGQRNVYYSNCSGAWAALPDLIPGAVGAGGSIVYNSSDSRYYVLRGGTGAATLNINNLYYSTGGAWGTAANVSVTDGETTMNYYPSSGASMVSNGTNLYVMVGNGETAFLRYNTAVGASQNTWTKLSATPFSQYIGTDMTYDTANGKIYALAGYYKDETWEFDTNNEAAGWRRLPNIQQYAFGRGPYNGASVEYVGNNKLLAAPGLGASDIWSFSIDSADNYEASGTYVSHTLDLGQIDSWGLFVANYDEPANTEITYESMTSEDGETWPGEWDEITQVTKVGGEFTGEIEEGSENRYIKIRATLTTTDGTYTPTLKDFTIQYDSSDTPPDNPVIAGYSQYPGGVAITSGSEYTYVHPYFTWEEPDNNGSDIAGYWVCFGKSGTCSDPETDGVFQAGQTYLVNEAMEFDDGEEFGSYYLKIKSQDNNGKVATEDLASFTYIYTGVSPYTPIAKSAQAEFNLGTTSDTSVISSGDGAVRLESQTGFWNQTNLSLQNASVNTGAELASGTCQGSENHCLYTFRGTAGTTALIYYTIETDTWATKTASVLAAVGAGATLTEGPEGYLYAVRGGGNSNFWLYDIAQDDWSDLENVPAQVNDGSMLQYDGSRYVYLTPGGDNTLFQFDTCNGVEEECSQIWTSLHVTDFNNPNETDGQKLSVGADGVYDGRNNLYITQGGYYPYFSKYTISADPVHGETGNVWTPLTQAPAGFYNGGCMAYDGENENIYALTGNTRMKFFLYSIASGEWTELPDAPATISHGASMVVYDGYIYIQRGGGATNFYRFNIEENSWELPNRGFFGPSTITGTYTSPYGSYYPYTTGTYITDDGNENLYTIRGGYDNTFGRYNVSEGTFTDLARLPVGAYNGANLIYVENKGAQGRVYYAPGAVPTVRTSNNNYFYRYDIATNIWTEITATRPTLQTGYGSSMVYDGSQYLYLTRGGSTGVTTWWRFDVNTEAWYDDADLDADADALINTTLIQQAGAKMVFVDNGANDKIYALRGGNQTNFYVCDLTVDVTSSNCWSAVANTPPLGINTGGSLTNGGDGYLYAVRGGNNQSYYRWPLTGGAWEETPTIPNVPVLVTTGGSGTNMAARNWTTAGYTAGGTNNVYPDGLYSYVVGSSSAGTGFSKTGTYTSAAIDLEAVYKWANLTATYTLPDNTYLTVETRTSDDDTACEDTLCENKDWSDWTATSNLHSDGNIRRMNINSSAKEFIQIRFSFTSSDRIYSPTISDFEINFYQDLVPPAAPSSVDGYASSAKTETLENESGEEWFNHAEPYFEWPETGEEGGASDNSGGSGIEGYYVCFGTDVECPDAIANGEPQEENSFTAPTLNENDHSGETYYLKIAAVDNAGLPSESFTAFEYNFDLTLPTLPTDISVSPSTYSSASEFTWSWSDDMEDAHSGIDRFQYRLGNEDPATWHELTNLGTFFQIVAPYQPNKNEFYLKVLDMAGNENIAEAGDFLWSGGAASPPTNLEVNPGNADNVTNRFTFTWDIPESYAGDSSKITYFYSVNYDPTPYNTVETTATSAGPGPFATQFGENTFKIVAMSEGGSKTNPNDVDWDNPVEIPFYARTTAPGPPVNNQVFDTSDREAQEYSVAIKWSAPQSYDSGNFAGYVISRSLDGNEFEEVATTTGTAYVDTELESRIYYYYVQSRDRTNNLSTQTSTLSLIPTGRYTSPPAIVTEPSVTVESFAATIAWSTNRVASSFVEYGTSVSLGDTNGQVDSVTAHTVTLEGLKAATKYFYKVKYIDPDGNIGTSDIGNFTTNDPPTISDVVTDGVGLDGATISWTTNMSGTCTLKYGEGSFSNSIEESSGGTAHIQKISSLKSATQYLYQVECLDVDANSFESDQYAFTTLEQPRVENFTVQNKENVDIPTIEVVYTTTHSTTTLVKFKGGDESNFHNYLISEYATEHKTLIEGLDPAVEYEVVATGIDQNGVEATTMSAKVTTLTDSRPPGITTNRATGRVIGLGKESRANLYVKIETDESTSAKVLFGKGIILSNFEQSTVVDPNNTYHLITIPVDPGQVYSYVVEAVDAADNKTNSKPATVVVEGAKENATEIVVNTFGNKFGWVSKLWQR